MAGLTGIAILIFLLATCKSTVSSEKDSKEELVQSESKDGKLEIIKQIKKVNDDGSYTIGYEADDGSFKIESRDVLGNIKGTYGYIDDSGHIKRVSYSTSNSSELLAKPDPTSSVVQRIPKLNRTTILTTRRPSYSTTIGTPTSTNVIQRLSKIRNFSGSSTTEKPNYSDVVNMEQSTAKPVYVVQSSTPRILLQGRPILRSSPAPQIQKSEGQLIRPEVTVRPTELPLFRRLAMKHPFIGEGKPITEQPEIRGNILRRQLSQEKTSNFDPQQHVYTIQQSVGADSTDVYSASVTTGTPRPLFTTTLHPRGALLSTTQAPVIISRPTIKYATNYQRNVLEDLEANTQEYAQENSTPQPTASETTSTPVPVVQIPANRPTQEPLVAIRHPNQGRTIFVPLSQIRGRIVPVENVQQQQQENQQQQYVEQPQYQTTARPVQEVEPRPVYLRRLPPPQFTPIPVQVDENGYIRDIPQRQNIAPTPYPLPVPITPKYVNNDVDNEIDQISPPVSTRDFQKLLQQLIVRQTRLERISALTDPRRHPEYYQPRYRPAYRPQVPYYDAQQQQGPVRFVNAEDQRQRQYVQISQQEQELIRRRQEQDLYRQQYEAQAQMPSRRVARLLQPAERPQQEVNDDYLPPDVREMLLLRMLQLAINPALPLNNNEEMVAESTTPVPQYKKSAIRNVEILGEEEEEKRTGRIKRFRESQVDYYE